MHVACFAACTAQLIDLGLAAHVVYDARVLFELQACLEAHWPQHKKACKSIRKQQQQQQPPGTQ
jgi:hypothetical protein